MRSTSLWQTIGSLRNNRGYFRFCISKLEFSVRRTYHQPFYLMPLMQVTLVKMVNEATANIPGWDDDDDDNSELRSKFEELNELHTLKLIQETEKNYI